MLHLEAGPVHNQPGGGPGDHFIFHKIIGFQRVTGLHQIHNPISQPDQGSQLNRSIEFNQFHRQSLLVEKPFGNCGVLCGHPKFGGQPLNGLLTFRSCHYQFTDPQIQVDRFIHIRTLLQ
jgi:hypothetical protein